MPKLGPPTLDPDRCTACGLCVKDCASMVLALEPTATGERRGRLGLAHPDWCNACGHCEAVCPAGAIRAPMPQPEGAPKPGRAPAVEPEQLALLLRERRSVRVYKAEPVPRALLERVIEVARYTPTGTNSQNVHWLVLEGEAVTALRDRAMAFYRRLFTLVDNPVGGLAVRLKAGARQHAQLRDYLPVVREAERRMAAGDDRMLYGAPAVVLVHAEAWDACSPFNANSALFSASLMAHSHGLGCCFNGFVQQAVENSRPLKAWLGIPREHHCYMAMTVGWPAHRYAGVCERQPAPIRWMDR